MPLLVPLQATPNQALTVRLDGQRYRITIKEALGGMVASIERGDSVLVNGVRCVAGTPLLAYNYLESGNFIFTTPDGEVPYYSEFGSRHILVFLSSAEIEAA